MKGKKIYEPPRFMSCKTAVEQLLEAEQVLGKGCYNQDTLCFGLARIGGKDQKIVAGKMKDFLDKIDMGPPLHSFVICADELHEIEKEMFEFYEHKE